MKLSKLKLVAVLFILLTTRSIKLAHADQESQFLIDYDIEYNIQEAGDTNVVQTATITNLKNDVIPTTYTFATKQLEIYDVEAETNNKSSQVRTEDKNGETLISVTISNYAIGEGRQNEIKLSYKTKNIATKTGKIWNIYVPKIQIPDTTTKYDVKLLIPISFGSKIYLSPTPVIEKKEGSNNTFYFTKEIFKTNGISAAFGEYQPLNFKLKYQLKNSSILPLLKEIALPSDIISMQSVSYKSINPKPFRIKLDKDGNVIATYITPPLKELRIEVMGTAKLFGKQINPDFGRSFSEIPKDLANKYTKEQKYWEVNSPYVQKLSQQLKDENLNVIKNAQKIYQFITQNLTYDFNASEQGLVERKGAEAALTQKGSWTCMEFTDLFIATARAMGIPAREVNGYAFTSEESNKPVSINLKGGDLLHAWAEFYDPYYGWIQVDPTWGTTSGIDYFTKLDTNHFSFVVKGLSSEYPFPAGAYRFSDNEKLIESALSQSIVEDDFKPKIEVKKILNLNVIRTLKGYSKVKVTNIGDVFVYKLNDKTLPIKSSTTIYIRRNQKEINFEDINGNKYSQGLESL
ncbi:transglutaminase domain-containing protein [candidate division WWE3 bacterium]|uniref:Transglutaminase domain-containing protein n=1 Tax=candidate division WWE3 bacterium TaxID=2053526 RepID=A0A7X9E758_UNCKA|nr:transglutaminase domain-containing protein [candidate division WWE3 bacterium]